MTTRIQALDFSVDLLIVILWQYDSSPNLRGLLERKQFWYGHAQTEFWNDWYADVFNLQTANDFGLAVWAIILGIPLVVSPINPGDQNIFGFGPDEEFTFRFTEDGASRILDDGAFRVGIVPSSSVLAWTPRVSPAASALVGIAYGAGRYVAIGQGTPNQILSSADGVTWTEENQPTTTPDAICWSGSEFLVVMGGDTVSKSADGLSWTESATTGVYPGQRNGVAHNGTRYFLAVEDTDFFYYSSDGTAWVETALANAGSNNAVLVDGGTFRTVGCAKVGQTFNFSYGPGDSMTLGSIPSAVPDADVISCVSQAGSLYSAFAFDGTQSFKSSDGVTWTADAQDGLLEVRGMASDGANLVVVGHGGNTMHSTDGITWTRVLTDAAELRQVVFAEGQFVAVAADGANQIFTGAVTGGAVATGNDNVNFTLGNFAADASGGAGLTTEQKRLILRLRYFQLITRGAAPEVNEFLSFIFGPGAVYVNDSNQMAITYVFASALPSAVELILTQYDLLPRPAGVLRNFVVDGEASGWGFGRYHLTFTNGNFLQE